jgi:anti-anti-sigma factor
MSDDYETEDYKVRLYHGVTVVRLKNPNLSQQHEVNRIGAEIKAMIGQGVRKMIVDFKHVTHCGSAGLGMLIAVNQAMKQAGGQMVLSHPEHIDELLRVSKTASLFKIAADPKDGVGLF